VEKEWRGRGWGFAPGRSSFKRDGIASPDRLFPSNIRGEGIANCYPLRKKAATDREKKERWKLFAGGNVHGGSYLNATRKGKKNKPQDGTEGGQRTLFPISVKKKEEGGERESKRL